MLIPGRCPAPGVMQTEEVGRCATLCKLARWGEQAGEARAMTKNPTSSPEAEEVTRLRGCLNDLVNIMALPALWTGGEPPQDVSAMLSALPGMLDQVARRTSALATANQKL